LLPKQPGSLSVAERLRELSAQGELLEKRLELVDFEPFLQPYSSDCKTIENAFVACWPRLFQRPDRRPPGLRSG
jgi:hypothetical protein